MATKCPECSSDHISHVSDFFKCLACGAVTRYEDLKAT